MSLRQNHSECYITHRSGRENSIRKLLKASSNNIMDECRAPVRKLYNFYEKGKQLSLNLKNHLFLYLQDKFTLGKLPFLSIYVFIIIKHTFGQSPPPNSPSFTKCFVHRWDNWVCRFYQAFRLHFPIARTPEDLRRRNFLQFY